MFENLQRLFEGLGIVAESFVDSLFTVLAIFGLFYIAYLLIKAKCEKKK